MPEQDPEKSVWLLCLSTGKPIFPNLSVLGVFSTRERAEETLQGLPLGETYILYRAPIDEFFGYVGRDGLVKDGMGQLQHHHFESGD